MSHRALNTSLNVVFCITKTLFMELLWVATFESILCVKVSLLGVILVRIFPYSDLIRNISVFSLNAEKCGLE